MENYQVFFPCSSSSAVSVDDHGSSNLGSSDDGFDGLHYESSNDSFLGMKTLSQFLDIPRAEPETMFQSGINGVESSGRKREKKIRKPKFAFQTRSPVDILDDGYRWRKYGQKAVKNNKFPRSYYRCTHEGCKVKKQVQRVTGDEGLVLTTYENIHTHAIDKPIDSFENILDQMQIYPSLLS